MIIKTDSQQCHSAK